jgi:glycosyltransferase involved in cell wall biosynthesis
LTVDVEGRLRFCTIIARNYWAHARVLARSIRDHHPDASVTVLVIDGDSETVGAASRELFDVIRPDAIGLSERELHRMAAIYDVLELSTAVKPWLLRSMLKDDPAPVIFLDPDIEIFAPLDEAADLAETRGIVLTPHTLEPLPRDGFEPDELTILGSGTFNLGFLAVGRDSIPFLDWWADHLKRDGLISKEEGMFVDQRWVDLAPGLFDVHILRDPGWNVAYWNLAQRPISRFGTRYETAGRPLRFFHYSGFDPDRSRLSLFQGENPRVRLNDQPLVAELCERYANRLIDAGFRGYSRIVYGFAHTADGLALDETVRRLYRSELVAAERGGGTEPPDPFGVDARDFESWLRDPTGAHGMNRYLLALHKQRPLLQTEFPDVEGHGGRVFVGWALDHGVKNGDVLPRLLPPEPLGGARTALGVNVAGYMRAEDGVGEAGRLLVAALEAAGVPSSVTTYANTRSRQQAGAPDREGTEQTHPIDIVCVNADQLHHFAEDTHVFEKRRYRIGVWAWEVEELPDWMSRSAELVDEIWTYSGHAARAIASATTKPVHVVPPPILRPDARPLARGELGLPEGFVFLFAFDFGSGFERKNPLATIDAFSGAFTDRDDVHLVVKTVRGDVHPEDLETLRAAAHAHPNVSVRDGYLTREEHQALVAACDSFVSLHRAEGYGLHLAEAMALGKPVVATGYSGNLEFMDETNSRLVPYELVAIPAGCDPYPVGARWAEPDIAAAAAAMREVVDDPKSSRVLGDRAAADISRLHSPVVRGRLVASLLGRVPLQAPPFEAPAGAEEEVHEDVIGFEEVFDRVRSGPGGGSPTRWTTLSRFVRRLVSRLTRHTTEHQQKIDLAFAHKINHVLGELGSVAEHEKLIEELTAQIHELNARIVRERESRRELADELRRLNPPFDGRPPRSAG